MIILHDKFKTVHCYEVTNQNILTFFVTYIKYGLVNMKLDIWDSFMHFHLIT